VHSIGRVVSEHQFEDGTLGYKVKIEKVQSQRLDVPLPIVSKRLR
jgi:hypothetical protein